MLLFACAVEIAQYFQLAARLQIARGSALGVALGSHFDPRDFAAYACGALVVVLYERKRLGPNSALGLPR